MTVLEMLKMSQAQLDDLFTKSPAGEMPKGEAKGTAIVAPGTRKLTSDCMNAESEDAVEMAYFFGSGLPNARAAVQAALAI